MGIVTILLFISICQGSVRAAEGTDEPARTGSFSIEATPLEIVGPERAANFASVVPLEEAISWQITVPESYESGNPPGVLVYISPSKSGKLPRKWKDLPGSHNLIWIAADDSGNRTLTVRRITYALFAVLLVADRYSIDINRIYLSGFSGGARVAGFVAAEQPEIFKGEIYIGGAEIWQGELTPGKLEAMKRNRYVFLVGSEDDNRLFARRVASKYKDAGIEKVELKVISRLGHELPDERNMNDALKFLDGAPEQ
jgi:hypothetical protein